LIRAPVFSDPNRVFFGFSLDVSWSVPGQSPRTIASFYQPFGDDLVQSADKIQLMLEEKTTSPQ
jgi:hypothetical protein